MRVGVVDLEGSAAGLVVVDRPLGLDDRRIVAAVQEGKPATAGIQVQHLERLQRVEPSWRCTVAGS